VAEDFVRLLGSSVDPEIRHKELDGLIQFYHECLTRKLREKGVYRTPFTVEQIKFAYERLFGQVRRLPIIAAGSLYKNYFARFLIIKNLSR
jgi:hypothetical protein